MLFPQLPLKTHVFGKNRAFLGKKKSKKKKETRVKSKEKEKIIPLFLIKKTHFSQRWEKSWESWEKSPPQPTF